MISLGRNCEVVWMMALCACRSLMSFSKRDYTSLASVRVFSADALACLPKLSVKKISTDAGK
mgnify:CR=1 FL=1